MTEKMQEVVSEFVPSLILCAYDSKNCFLEIL